MPSLETMRIENGCSGNHVMGQKLRYLADSRAGSLPPPSPLEGERRWGTVPPLRKGRSGGVEELLSPRPLLTKEGT